MLPYNVRLNSTKVREYAGGSSVGGILRKTGHNNNSNTSYGNNVSGAGSGSSASQHDARQVELLVFGYACKIFRDDDKARNIDQGKHLIPWMGDANLKIDRYDVRGALYDLAPHEAPPGGYGNRLDYLSADEQRAEQLCEEERYLYLYNNEEEHILQQEEDLKRLKQETEGGDFSQVGFQYGNAQPAIDSNTSTSASTSNIQHNEEGGEQPFVPPSNFVFAAHLNLPETMKQHAIIEKTARFIASQGVQMEILLKAKQSNNVQFEFLNQNSLLNPYYKFIVEAIKQGTYPEVTDTTTEANKTTASVTDPNVGGINNENDSYGGCGSFLSGGATKKMPPITVPTIKYKPSANCAYTQLISKIKGVPLQTVIDEDSNNSGIFSPATSNKSSQSSSTEFTPVLLRYNGNTFTHNSTEDGEASNTNSNEAADAEKGSDNQSKVEVLKNTSALALAQNYCSDTDDSDSNNNDDNDDDNVKDKTIEPELTFPIPEENLRHIIDKTATYVIKNGRQFEETLRAKSVERFTFLLPDNEYYPYYMYKITNDPNAASKELKARKAAAVAAALLSKKGLTGGSKSKTAGTVPSVTALTTTEKLPVPVSFSIKSKDEHAPLQPALPQEASDDEDANGDDENTSERTGIGKGNDNNCIPSKLNEDLKTNVRNNVHDDDSESGSGSGSNGDRHVPERVQKAIQMVEAQLQARNTSTSTNLLKPELTSPEQNRQKEIKKAEEKFKDKLALIAREKLGGLLTKEKQLQLERKRKAMAFLNQIKSGDSSASNANTRSTIMTNIATPDATTKTMENIKETNSKSKVNQKRISKISKNNNNNDIDDDDDVVESDASSVRSIPITSYGPEDDDDDNEQFIIMNNINPQIGPVNRTTTSPLRDLQPSSTNATKSSTVLLSDDDDVQLISETHAQSVPASPTSSSVKEKYKKRHLKESVKHKDHSNDVATSNSSRDISKHKSKKRKHKSTIQESEEYDERDHRHHHHHHRHRQHRQEEHHQKHHYRNNYSVGNSGSSSRKRRRHDGDEKHIHIRSRTGSRSSLVSSTVSSGTNDSSSDTTTSSNITTSESVTSTSIDSYKRKVSKLRHKKVSNVKKKSSSESMRSSSKLRRDKSPSRHERSTSHRRHQHHQHERHQKYSKQHYANRDDLAADLALLRHKERERERERDRERDRDRDREREREREQERFSRKYQYRDDRESSSRQHRHHRSHTPPIANNKISKRNHYANR